MLRSRGQVAGRSRVRMRSGATGTPEKKPNEVVQLELASGIPIKFGKPTKFAGGQFRRRIWVNRYMLALLQYGTKLCFTVSTSEENRLLNVQNDTLVCDLGFPQALLKLWFLK